MKNGVEFDFNIAVNGYWKVFTANGYSARIISTSFNMHDMVVIVSDGIDDQIHIYNKSGHRITNGRVAGNAGTRLVIKVGQHAEYDGH